MEKSDYLNLKEYCVKLAELSSEMNHSLPYLYIDSISSAEAMAMLMAASIKKANMLIAEKIFPVQKNKKEELLAVVDEMRGLLDRIETIVQCKGEVSGLKNG